MDRLYLFPRLPMNSYEGSRMLEKALYRPAEAQKLLGIKNTKFYALVKEGALECRKLGGATVVPAESLKRFIENLPKAA
jgi:excisionase family DNA binding protein